MTWLWFVIASLATYYAARSIAQEDGPWGVLDRIRLRFDSGYIGKGIRCVVCVSAYTALAAALFMALLGLYDVWLWPLVWLGLAGASVKISEFWKR